MIKPPTPIDETRRLRALRDLKIMDTAPEERFDRVTRLARRVFGVPIALVSLVDEDRQWFKSRQGLEAEQTSRDISFCGHAIVHDRIMVVKDATQDDRFCDNPLVSCDPNVRFYAGYPLNAPDGSKVGTLCVIDQKPRDMSEEDLNLLRELGRMIEEELLSTALSTTDPATGLSNQTGFSLVGDHLLAMCRRLDVPASLLVFDIKNLPRLEQYEDGSRAEQAVIELTHLLMTCFRDCDAIARLSRNSFGVLLAGANLDGADKGLERLRGLIMERNNSREHDIELDVAADAVVYKPGRHANVIELAREIEERGQDSQPEAPSQPYRTTVA